MTLRSDLPLLFQRSTLVLPLIRHSLALAAPSVRDYKKAVQLGDVVTARSSRDSNNQSRSIDHLEDRERINWRPGPSL